MNNSTKFTGRKLESFLSKLSELVDALPSVETKSQLDRELDILIGFLLDFRTRLNSLPTLEDTDGIRSTIETLNDFVRVAESNPAMSRILGFQSSKGVSKTPSRISLTEDECREAKIIAQKLKRLAPKESMDMLADTKKYTVAMLRQIAEELGIKFASKSTRQSMVDTIIKKMENHRGYDLLMSGGSVRR